MFEMIFLGLLCGLIVAWYFGRSLADPEPQTPEFDQARVDSVFAELDRQEMKTKRVRAGV